MPFTPTHIVAIIPVAAMFRRFPFSALAIGSMVPDLPMFFPLFDYAQTHSTVGIFLVCMPCGMAIFMLYQCIVKTAVIAILPVWIQQRLTKYSRPLLLPSIPFYLCVATALVAGAATHVVWDAFTHEGRWGTQLIPALNMQFHIAGFALPGYKIFQYGSTVIGLPLLLVLSVVKLFHATPITISDIRPLSGIVKVSTLTIIALIPVIVATIVLRSDVPSYERLGMIVKTSGSLIGLVVIALSLVFHIFNRGKNSP